MGAREFKREGTYIYLQLIHVVWQKLTQHCKAIIFQLKKLKILILNYPMILLCGSMKDIFLKKFQKAKL